MKSNKVMLAVFLFLSNNLMAQEDVCFSEQKELSGDFRVYSSPDKYLGYVSPNKDGSWFVWVDSTGALNADISSKDQAVEVLCNEAARSIITR